jgi:pimeloyl-ACP methyl ester carboxylesterase
MSVRRVFLLSIILALGIALTAPGVARAGAWNCGPSLPMAPARGPAAVLPGAGRAHIDIASRSRDAQKFFDQGLALLLEGWSYEADHDFAQAATYDPGCAMAQWGIAMADLNPARRDSALAHAQSLAANAGALQQLYVAAAAARRPGADGAGSGSDASTADDYRRALRKIIGAYPDETAARLLLAQAQLGGYEPDGTPGPGTLEAIALCEVVLHKDVTIAAAYHTLAHAYEGSPAPDKAAQAAAQFVKFAPAVAHGLVITACVALHIGHPDDAIRALETAASVDETWMRKQDEISAHSSGPYHQSLVALADAYSDAGRRRDALRTASRLLERGRARNEVGGPAALDGRLATIRTLVRCERWDDILDGRTLPDDGGFEVVKPWRHYALGRAWLARGDADHAWGELMGLDHDMTRLKSGLPKNALLRSLQESRLQALSTTTFELKGRTLAREGMGAEAIGVLRQGVQVGKAIGVAASGLDPEPIARALGDVALDLKRWNDAAAAYRQALAGDAGDGEALLGLARSLEGAGQGAEAAEPRARLAKLWLHADPDATPAPPPRGSAPRAAIPAPVAHGANDAASASGPNAGPDVTPAVAPDPAPAATPVVAAAAPPPTVPAPADPYANKLRKTRVNGVQLAYVQIGRGDPVVLVHGELADYREWGPQLDALAQHHKVVAYSRRYHYPNPPADEHADYTYAANEQDLAALIKALHLGKVHLLAHGYGGVVATMFTRDHPEEVRSLMLVEPGVYSMIPWKKERRAALETLKAAASSSSDAVRTGDLERAVRQFYGAIAGGGAFDSLPDPQRRMMQDNARTLLLGVEPPPAFPCEELTRITTRTLLIEGDATPRNEHLAVEGLERCLPNRDHATIDGATRVVNSGNPEAFNDVVTRFLDSPDRPVDPSDDGP